MRGSSTMFLCALFLALSLVALAQESGPPPAGPPCHDCPNIVLLLTDDQDAIIGGWDPMHSTAKRVQAKGATASEWRIHTPICAPSRGELQSGRYLRNIKSNETTPSPAVSGGAVDQIDLGGKVWPYVFATTLRREKGYVTGLFGKCMNGDCGVNKEQGYSTDPEANLHLMGAFDRWFEHAGYVNGRFFDNEAEGCSWPWEGKGCYTPTFEGGVWSGRGDGYDTATIGNVTVEWIRKVAGKGRPFFAYFAPHAPHSPATPAPWYKTGTFCDGIESPRLPNWNYTGPHRTGCSLLPPSKQGAVWWWNSTDFHELVSCQPYFDTSDANGIDNLARNRCRTLLSVDDAYSGILDVLEEVQVMDNTYILVTSDHGYNLGHHMLPSDKFLLYEHALRIPMLFMGPGIPQNSTIDFLGTQVDLAPTILGLAGIDTPEYMDGKSVVPLLIKNTTGLPGSVKHHLARTVAPTRTSSFHMYYNQGCWECGTRHPLDDWSNTYIALRYKGDQGSWKFGIYDPYGKETNFTQPYMFELFNLADDPYELHNIYNATKASRPELVEKLTDEVYKWYHCSGRSCA